MNSFTSLNKAGAGDTPAPGGRPIDWMDGLSQLRQRLLLPAPEGSSWRKEAARQPENGSRSGLFSTINKRFVQQRTGRFRRQQFMVYALEVAILGAGIWFLLSGSR
jgi:hypothetical protein